MLHERDIWFDKTRLRFVVAQPRPGIECAYVIQRSLYCLNGAVDGARNLFVLLVLERLEVLIDYRDGIGKHLRGPVTVSISKALMLSLVIPQLIEETIAQIAASDSWRVELPDDLNRLVQVLRIKTGLIRQPCAVVRCRGFVGSGCFLWRCRLRYMLRSGFRYMRVGHGPADEGA